jgi:hypothetical protein
MPPSSAPSSGGEVRVPNWSSTAVTCGIAFVRRQARPRVYWYTACRRHLALIVRAATIGS